LAQAIIDEGGGISILFPDGQGKSEKCKEFSALITSLVLFRGCIREAAMHERLLHNSGCEANKKQKYEPGKISRSI
jgi:hypothetical protein